MQKIIIILITVILLNISCKSNVEDEKSKSRNSELLDFFVKNESNPYYRKIDIPTFIIDTLSKIDSGRFEIADKNENDKLSFSDNIIDENNRYNRQINFVYKTDSACMLVYKKGGIGTYYIIDYFRYRNAYYHKRITSSNDLDTKEKLEQLLKKIN